MKLYLKNGNILEIDANTKLQLLNAEEFVMAIKSLKSPPGVQVSFSLIASLRYILVHNSIQYLGESVANFKGRPTISNNIDIKSPYKVELVNWKLSDSEDKYLEFIITEQNKMEFVKDNLNNSGTDNIDDKAKEDKSFVDDKKASERLNDRAYELLDLPFIQFKYGELQFFRKHEIDVMQKGYRNNPQTNEIYDDWAGTEYILVGFDATAGLGADQFIVKTDEEKLPVYWLMTDGGDWSKPDFICDSLEKFSKIIKLLKQYEYYLENGSLTKNMKDEIYNKICEIMDTTNINYYWDSLLNNALDRNYN